LRLSIILLLLSLSLVIFASLPETGSGQQNTTTDAWNSIVRAFTNVRLADSDGAAHDSIVTLSIQLNIALIYYNNATIFAAQNNTASANNYSNLSISVSSNVAAEAKALDDTVRNQQLVRQEVAYGAAFILAVISATLVVELDRFQRLFRKRKIVMIENASS
jgi:hypothetical protein